MTDTRPAWLDLPRAETLTAAEVFALAHHVARHAPRGTGDVCSLRRAPDGTVWAALCDEDEYDDTMFCLTNPQAASPCRPA